MSDYLANVPTFRHSCTSYTEIKPLAIATHSKGFKQIDHTLHLTKD